MVKKQIYVPERGDIIWFTFAEGYEREQYGRRPALVISPKQYNEWACLASVCPITSQIKGYSFEVPIHEGKIAGVVLADQIRSIDWGARRAAFIMRAHYEIIENVQQKLLLLIT